jgi:hypothetical protein
MSANLMHHYTLQPSLQALPRAQMFLPGKEIEGVGLF